MVSSKLLLIGGAIAAAAVVGAVAFTRQLPPEQRVAQLELSANKIIAEIGEPVTFSVRAVNALGAPATQQSISAGQFGNFPLTDDYGTAELGVIFEKPGQYMVLASAGGIQSDTISIVVTAPPPVPEIKGAITTTTVEGQPIALVESTQFVEVTGAPVEQQSLLQAAQLIGQPVISSTSLATLGATVAGVLNEAQKNADIAANTITVNGRTFVGRIVRYDEFGNAFVIPYDYGIVGYAADGSYLFARAELAQDVIPAPPKPTLLNPSPTTISKAALEQSQFAFLLGQTLGVLGSTIYVSRSQADSLNIGAGGYTLVP